jgi:ABC-type polar amino acid transport system ATPase subunit
LSGIRHEIGFAREVADTVVFIDQGVKAEEAPAARFFNNPTQERTRFFLSKILL